MIQVNGAQVAAEGRQVVFGGACVGKISSNQRDFLGVAAFVSQKNGLSLSTPIIGFDFQSRASAGLAVGILGVNTERPGGITEALRAIDYAAARGLGTILHNQPLGIASAAQVHIGAARAPVLGHAMELFGHIMLEDDLIVAPLDYSGGRVRVPDGPGFGVALDEAALERYATAPATIIQR